MIIVLTIRHDALLEMTIQRLLCRWDTNGTLLAPIPTSEVIAAHTQNVTQVAP
jgi:hypothetical protein